MARILAVDDERAILDALARVLGRDGHEVVRAADPTAVPGMDLSRFDLVLCDVMMPGLDGFELVRQIRPDFDGPIVFLTARVAEEDAVAAYGPVKEAFEVCYKAMLPVYEYMASHKNV